VHPTPSSVVSSSSSPGSVSVNFEAILARSGFPGWKMIPAACAIGSLLALKLFGNSRRSHVMSLVHDEGLALFAGLNVVLTRSFLTDYRNRIEPTCYPKLMRNWFDAAVALV
jgi:hypothetical protein